MLQGIVICVVLLVAVVCCVGLVVHRRHAQQRRGASLPFVITVDLWRADALVGVIWCQSLASDLLWHVTTNGCGRGRINPELA